MIIKPEQKTIQTGNMTYEHRHRHAINSCEFFPNREAFASWLEWIHNSDLFEHVFSTIPTTSWHHHFPEEHGPSLGGFCHPNSDTVTSPVDSWATWLAWIHTENIDIRMESAVTFFLCLIALELKNSRTGVIWVLGTSTPCHWLWF